MKKQIILTLIFLFSIQSLVAKEKNDKKYFLKKSITNDLKHIKYYPIKAFQLNPNSDFNIIGIRQKMTFCIYAGWGMFAKTRFRMSVIKLDNKLNFISEKKLNFKNVEGISFPFYTGGQNIFYLYFIYFQNFQSNQFEIIKWNNDVVAFCPKRTKRSTLYRVNVDLENVQLSNLKEFASIKNEKKLKINKVDYHYKFSADSNFFCIICKYRYVHTYDERLSVWLYTKKYKLKYYSDFLYNKGLKKSALSSFNVSNFGEVMLTKTYFKYAKNSIKTDSTELFFIDSFNLEPIKEIIKSDDNYLPNPFIKFNKFQNPLIMGLYGNEKNTKGLFYSTFSEDLGLRKLRYVSFSKFPKNYLEDKSINEDNKTKLTFNEYFQTTDSSYITISYYYNFKLNYTKIGNFTDEYTQYEVQKNEYRNNDGYTHTMGNFVITKLDKKKKPVWVTEVNRNLIEVSYAFSPTSYSSYYRYIDNNKLTMIFADNLSETGKKSKNPFWRKMYTRVAEINLITGKVEISNFFNDEMQKKNVLLPSKIFPLNNYQVLMLAYRKSIQSEGISSTNYLLKSILFDFKKQATIK